MPVSLSLSLTFFFSLLYLFWLLFSPTSLLSSFVASLTAMFYYLVTWGASPALVALPPPLLTCWSCRALAPDPGRVSQCDPRSTLTSTTTHSRWLSHLSAEGQCLDPVSWGTPHRRLKVRSAQQNPRLPVVLLTFSQLVNGTTSSPAHMPCMIPDALVSPPPPVTVFHQTLTFLKAANFFLHLHAWNRCFQLLPFDLPYHLILSWVFSVILVGYLQREENLCDEFIMFN